MKFSWLTSGATSTDIRLLMNDFLTALSLILVIEGVACAVIPEVMKRMVGHVLAIPSDRLRVGGVILVAVGVMLVWVIRG